MRTTAPADDRPTTPPGPGWRTIRIVLLALALTATLATAVTAAEPPQTMTGELPSGGNYLFEIPDGWNGTVVVDNPGYRFAGTPRPAPRTLPEPQRSWLLERGYALAGGAYSSGGWAVQEALVDRDELIGRFRDAVGPATVVVHGTSMGGNVSAALLQYRPDLVDGALIRCGSVAGTVAMANAYLDAGFVLKTLVNPASPVELVDVTMGDFARLALGRALIRQASSTPEGRARLALAGAVAQLPTWWEADAPKPGPRDWDAQLDQMALAAEWSVFAPRSEHEQRAGGNFSWNTGVDYRRQLMASGLHRLVHETYRKAGADLREDLATLQSAPRIAADPEAVTWAESYFTPTGEIDDPVLLLHPTGDSAPEVTQTTAYAAAVRTAGNASLLRRAFIDRPGHCTESPEEVLAALEALFQRVEEGSWGRAATVPALREAAHRIAVDLPAELRRGEHFIHLSPAQHVRAHEVDGQKDANH